MARRFYNPGSKITETVRFDHPTNDIRTQNLISYYPLEAEAESFFDVPTEVIVTPEGGDPVGVSVDFWKRILKDYRDFGVVMVDPKRDTKKKPIGDEENVALNDKDAKAKGDLMWKDAMYRLVREHEDKCREARNAGMRPKRAFGNVKHALDALGIVDPANDIEDVVQRKQDTSENEQLKKRLAELEQIVLNMATKGGK